MSNQKSRGWEIGDWAVQQHRLNRENVNERGKKKFGQESTVTVKRARLVAEAFPPGTRRDVSFSHHVAAYALPAHIRFVAVAHAEKKGMNLVEFRAHVKALKRKRKS